MKELIRVRVKYASRQQCCKTHKRPLPLPLPLPLDLIITIIQSTGVHVHALKAYRESNSMAPLILNLRARWRHYIPEKELRTQRIGDRLGLTACLDVLRREKYFASIGIRTRELSARKLVATPTKLSRLHPINILSSNRREK